MRMAIHQRVREDTMELSFEWDEVKAAANRKKHQVSFDEAATVFADPFAITIPDPDHPADEQRFVDLGTSDRGRLLVVIYTERGATIRIISCRNATRSERKLDEEGTSDMEQKDLNDMRAEYDFAAGVRGKHYRAMQGGYTITVHRPDGTKVFKEVMPNKGVVVLEPDVQEYFPDSASVNATLRALIKLIPAEHAPVPEKGS